MKLYIIIFLLVASLHSFAGDIVISKDTTISGTWVIPTTTIVRFETGGHIHGTGSISGGIIQAAYNQWIFDTSVAVSPTALYNQNFSARWYGADPANADNRTQLQTAINTCLNRFPLFIPQGNYKISAALFIQYYSGGSFQGCTIHIFGEANWWSWNVGTVITVQGNNSGFALQQNKGTEIDHITIQGQWRSPNTPDSVYFKTTQANYTDASGQGITSSSRAIIIDYSTNQNGSNSGSTGIYIHDCTLQYFYYLVIGSLNGSTLNNDCLYLYHNQYGDCNTAIVSTQGQEKGNFIEGIYAWGSMHTFFQSGFNLNGQGGDYTLSKINIAGRCIRFLNVSQTGWGQINVHDGFFESIGTIGTINTSTALNITNCIFDFQYPEQAGYQTLLTTNSDNITFTSCEFRYFGYPQDTLHFSGRATCINCFVSGPIVNPYGWNMMNYPIPLANPPSKSSVSIQVR